MSSNDSVTAAVARVTSEKHEQSTAAVRAEGATARAFEYGQISRQLIYGGSFKAQ